MKRSHKITVAVLASAVAIVAGAYLYARAWLSPSSASAPPQYDLVKVTRGSISQTVTASGQLQPKTVTTIRADSNMPTRKLVALYVEEGDRVRAGQALAAVDASGLDLDLAAAKANVASQKARLDNLKAQPAALNKETADADLAQARTTLEAAQDSYSNTKVLADKGLIAKSQSDDARRQLEVAQLRYSAAQSTWKNAVAQVTDDVIKAQEAALAQAQATELQDRLVFDSATIRSPVAGVVAEIPLNLGDLVSPSTAVMTVVDPDPMVLQAMVNEDDMADIRTGLSATVSPSSMPDLSLKGEISEIDMHAQIQSNVSVFQTSIKVPNRDGKLLWGMNADAEITVLNLDNVLVLPTNAIRTSGGASQVSILDGGKMVSWDVQTGPTDGTKTQIVAGLDEGDEVVIPLRKSSTSPPSPQGAAPGFNQVFRGLR
ncbi:MAG: efflux RND transporter periplasmic adaptor subunit [Treponema sp.]|nr:efflux RND transporter periplasmic adaptor subunit [Treponema sp.]